MFKIKEQDKYYKWILRKIIYLKTIPISYVVIDEVIILIMIPTKVIKQTSAKSLHKIFNEEGIPSCVTSGCETFLSLFIANIFV